MKIRGGNDDGQLSGKIIAELTAAFEGSFLFQGRY
jgi:hypothetical protein